MRFWSGLFTGVTITAAAFLLYLAIWVVPALRGMYGEFQAAHSPIVTAVALSPLWLWGSLTLLVLACTLLNASTRLRHELRVAGLAIVAIITIAALIFTAWAGYAPIYELAPIGAAPVSAATALG